MKFTYRNIATINAFILFLLALIWMLTPDVILSSWGVEYSYVVGMLCRRNAALYLGLSFMLFYTRNEKTSNARSMIVIGFSVACLSLAMLGVMEFVTGHAKIEILIAALIETIMAILLMYARKK